MQEPVLQSSPSYPYHQKLTENFITPSPPCDGVGVLLLIIIQTRSRLCTQSLGGEAHHDGVCSLIIIIHAIKEAAYSGEEEYGVHLITRRGGGTRWSPQHTSPLLLVIEDSADSLSSIICRVTRSRPHT